MKIKTMMVAALAAVTFASCSKDGDNNGKIEVGEKASLSVNVTSPAMGTRATGTPTADKIENYAVFVTNGSGEIEWTEYSADGSSITGMEVTSNASHVFIVANAGNLTTSITTKAQLDAKLFAMNETDGNQFSKRIATGNTTSPIVFTDNNGTLEANLSIDLTFIAARITVTIVDNMYGDYDATKTDGSLILKNVAILNASRSSKLF